MMNLIPFLFPRMWEQFCLDVKRFNDLHDTDFIVDGYGPVDIPNREKKAFGIALRSAEDDSIRMMVYGFVPFKGFGLGATYRMRIRSEVYPLTPQKALKVAGTDMELVRKSVTTFSAVKHSLAEEDAKEERRRLREAIPRNRRLFSDGAWNFSQGLIVSELGKSSDQILEEYLRGGWVGEPYSP